jgi:hypothetical protein
LHAAAALLGGQDGVGQEAGIVGAQQVGLFGLQVTQHTLTLTGLRCQAGIRFAAPLPAQAEVVEGGVERAALDFAALGGVVVCHHRTPGRWVAVESSSERMVGGPINKR